MGLTRKQRSKLTKWSNICFTHPSTLVREAVKVKGLLIVGTGEKQEVRGTESGRRRVLESGPGVFEKL